MASITTLVLGALAATYVFLRVLLRLTQDAREPPAILTGLPFISPVIRMGREKQKFYTRLRDEYNLPIYTLRMPFSRMYIVNSTELIPELQRHWRTVSFGAISAGAGAITGMSDKGLELLNRDLQNEHGFTLSTPKFITPSMAPGEDLDAMNRRAVEIYAEETEALRARGAVRVGLREWVRQIMVTSTSEAVWGPQNPYGDAAIAEAWRTFESGFLALILFPFMPSFFPKVIRARELIAAAMLGYMRKGGYKTASGLIRKRYEHHRDMFGMTLEDVARGELGNSFGVLSNSSIAPLWLLYHIFSDERVLADVRREVSALVVQESDGGGGGGTLNSVDLGDVRKACPVLMSTFQETMRLHNVNPGPRILLEDVYLDGGRVLLKKGSRLMIPATVQHTSVAAWGDDVGEFDHLRFTRKKSEPGRQRPNRVAFRAFGGGHVLCPGRHFASTEIMALTALMVLQFDIVPVAGRWVEPSCNNTPAHFGFAIPDEDIDVELRPRNPDVKWRVTFSGSDEAMGIVAEDIETREE